ncbi:DUF2793 domain-containing protein [Enterovirga aerilata]|nr:DUF2793 domain-containing protein [Enterovirga sp. DB1703]
MSETPNLGLPLLAAAQAQKHVTHNEALLALDALVHCAVLDRDLSAPPASPAEGDRYLVPAAPGGAWAGHAGEIAAFSAGAWAFHAPQPGFLCFAADEAVLLVFDGAAWAPAVPAALQNLARLGIGTSADAANPFSAKLNKALWTALGTGEGGTGDLRCTLNKEAASQVLSVLFQSGYSGRAELGLVGDDDLQLKTSADGTAWSEAMRVKADGKVGIGTSAPSERLTVAGNIAPASDNAHSLGTGTRRFSAIYAATGTVSTSDMRQKREVEPLDPGLALDLLREAPPIAFGWRSGESGRHFGWNAQAWLAALGARVGEAGLVVRLAPDRPDGELGLRPDQVTALLHAAVLELSAGMTRLAARVAALEADAT